MAKAICFENDPHRHGNDKTQQNSTKFEATSPSINDFFCKNWHVICIVPDNITPGR